MGTGKCAKSLTALNAWALIHLAFAFTATALVLVVVVGGLAVAVNRASVAESGKC